MKFFIKPVGGVFVLSTFLVSTLFLSACNGNHNSDKVLPEEPKTCFPESTLMAANIVGGQMVKEADADSHRVMMVMFNGELCTAAAIAPDVILTAAHCIQGDAKKSYVAFANSLSCESGFDVNKNTVDIADYVVFEKYDIKMGPSQAEGDLALVLLKSVIPFDYSIFKIAKPQLVSSNDNLYFYGYGLTGTKSGGSGFLRKTTITRSDYQIQEADKKIKVDQSHGTGICNGDSGGPALVEVNGELQILGVNSYVFGPENDYCSKGSYLVLVDSYRDWIAEKMQKWNRQLLE